MVYCLILIVFVQISMHFFFMGMLCAFAFLVLIARSWFDVQLCQATFDHVVSYASIYHLEKDEQCHLNEQSGEGCAIPNKGEIEVRGSSYFVVCAGMCERRMCQELKFFRAAGHKALHMLCCMLVAGWTACIDSDRQQISERERERERERAREREPLPPPIWKSMDQKQIHGREACLHPGSVGIQLVRKLKIGGRAFLGWNHGPVTRPDGKDGLWRGKTFPLNGVL